MRRATLSLCALGLLACAPQARFSMVDANLTKLTKEAAKVAVLVYADDEGKLAADELQAFITTGLVSRGFRARAFNLELELGKTQLSDLENGKYAVGEGLASGMRSGGRVEADARALEGLLSRTEKQDEIARYEALQAFIKKLPADWDYNYLLVVHQMGEYTFASYVIDVATHDVVNSFVISGNVRGFRTALPNPPTGQIQALGLPEMEQRGSIRDMRAFQSADLFRLGFYIASLL